MTISQYNIETAIFNAQKEKCAKCRNWNITGKQCVFGQGLELEITESETLKLPMIRYLCKLYKEA